MAALSKVDVANKALVEHLGAKAIVSFSDESVEANTVNALWESVRDRVLREFPWHCLIERAELASESGSAPQFGYEYGFPLPANFLRLIEINESGIRLEKTSYRIEKNTILYDVSGPLQIIYIKDSEDDVDAWDSLLIDYMAVSLAKACCKKINPDEYATIENEYTRIRNNAKRVNAQELGNPAREDDAWIKARRRG